ncbi:MAG: HAD family hydrolase [Pseudomonadota bacterium]
MTIRGIVFDKDGTLFQYAGTWALWCDSVLDRLSAGDAALKAKLAEAVGFDVAAQDFLAGSLIVGGSAGEVNTAWAEHLPDWDLEAIDAVAVEALEKLPTLPVCDLTALFSELTGRGLKLGIATNDYEAGATMQLIDAGVAEFFSFVCGFDSGHGAKPGPGMIDGFCAATGIPADAVAMVGDSTHDLGAGRAAKVGMNVGVLTGPAEHHDIAHMADHVLADISELPGLLARL